MFETLLFAAALGTVSVLDSAAHSADHYTQGLFFDGGCLYESTGGYGASKLYRYASPGTAPSDSAALNARYFGEGSVKLGNSLFWLTWREGTAFVLDAKTFAVQTSFPLFTEGWGLSVYKGSLLMTDGSENLLFLSPGEKRVFKKIPVKDGERKIRFLNEIEVVGGVVYANVWQSDSIAAVDPESGKVLSWFDFSKMAARVRKKSPRAEVLNGIAFDGKNFWVTGKFWPVIYKVRLER